MSRVAFSQFADEAEEGKRQPRHFDARKADRRRKLCFDDKSSAMG